MNIQTLLSEVAFFLITYLLSLGSFTIHFGYFLTEEIKLDTDTISVIDRFILKIKQSFSPKYVILFGSYSRGEQKEFSDIDIAVVFEKYEGTNILEDNAFLFRLAWEVDTRIEPVILSIDNDNSGFTESVLRNGKILYAA